MNRQRQRKSLAEFVDFAENNSKLIINSNSPLVQLLEQINVLFDDVIDAMVIPQSVVPALFIPRAHAGFYCAVRTASAGQVMETYPTLRLCLENALYAYFINLEPDRARVWAEREIGESQKKLCRKTFSNKAMIESLPDKLQILTRELYDDFIDFGGHPNPVGILTGIDHAGFKAERDVFTLYVQGEDAQLVALRNCARTAILVLTINGEIFKERYALCGFNRRIVALAGKI